MVGVSRLMDLLDRLTRHPAFMTLVLLASLYMVPKHLGLFGGAPSYVRAGVFALVGLYSAYELFKALKDRNAPR